MPNVGTFTVTQSTVSRHRSQLYSSHTSLQPLLCTLSQLLYEPHFFFFFINVPSLSEEDPAHIQYLEYEAEEGMSRAFGAKTAVDESGERWMRKAKEEKDGSEGWRITMGHVALLGLFGTSVSPVASGY